MRLYAGKIISANYEMKQNDLLMVNLKNDPQTALMLFNVLWQLVQYVKCMSVYESK